MTASSWRGVKEVVVAVGASPSLGAGVAGAVGLVVVVVVGGGGREVV